MTVFESLLKVCTIQAVQLYRAGAQRQGLRGILSHPIVLCPIRPFGFREHRPA